MNIPTHYWKCPRENCKYDTTTYTEDGRRALSEAHMEQHYREDRDNKVMTSAIILAKPVTDYNVLKITVEDLAFLKTRGVALDDQMELGGISKPTNEELPMRQWAKILNRVWGVK